MKYGITRNLLFERQLWRAFYNQVFTTRQAELIYKDTRRDSEAYVDAMNARNYLAGAVTAGTIRRIRKGRYIFPAGFDTHIPLGHPNHTTRRMQ